MTEEIKPVSAAAAPAPTFLLGQRSRARIRPFVLHRPGSVEEALRTKAALGERAVYFAGGLEVINRMKAGAEPGDVIDLRGIAGLYGIDESSVRPGWLRIGALATVQEVAASELVQARQPGMRAVLSALGSALVRFRATIGGNLMACEPAYDVAPLMMALGAKLNYVATGGSAGTAGADQPLPQGALLLSAEVPPGCETGLVADRSLKPVVSVFLGIAQQNGYLDRLNLAIGCAYSSPTVRVLTPADRLPIREIPRHAAALAARLGELLPAPSTDWRASAAYRSAMIVTLTRRLLAERGSAC